MNGEADQVKVPVNQSALPQMREAAATQLWSMVVLGNMPSVDRSFQFSREAGHFESTFPKVIR